MLTCAPPQVVHTRLCSSSRSKVSLESHERVAGQTTQHKAAVTRISPAFGFHFMRLVILRLSRDVFSSRSTSRWTQDDGFPFFLWSISSCIAQLSRMPTWSVIVVHYSALPFWMRRLDYKLKRYKRQNPYSRTPDHRSVNGRRKVYVLNISALVKVLNYFQPTIAWTVVETTRIYRAELLRNYRMHLYKTKKTTFVNKLQNSIYEALYYLKYYYT